MLRADQILDNDNKSGGKKEKKQRKESLLVKYGVIAFLEILGFISVFLVFMSRNIKAPIKQIYDDSVENFLDSAVDNVKMWFENQVTVMNVFQRAVVEPVDNPENIKHRIKTVPKPEGETDQIAELVTFTACPDLQSDL